MIKRVFLDIETTGLPDDQLDKLKPTFTAPSNYKDEAKIAANLVEQEAAWRERAALDASTGQVLCVGFCGLWRDSEFSVLEGEERSLVESFWIALDHEIGVGNTIIGFNIFGFDLPFMARRAWVHGLTVPRLARNGRYWNEQIIDLMDVWRMGNYEQRISLDNMSKALGMGAKNGSGAEFEKLWREDKPKALEYLNNDVQLLKLCADKMLQPQ